MRRAIDEFDEPVGNTFDAIEVKVGKLEQPESVESRRKIGERLLADHRADIEAVGASARSEAGEFEDPGNDAVYRDDALDDERSFALVDKTRAQVGLGVQAAAEEGRTQARGEGAEIGLVHVL